MAWANTTPDERRPSAMRLPHADTGLTRALSARPIKTRAAGDGHVDVG
jgi:hypothetical protein